MRRYDRFGRFDRGYIRGKLRHDPIHADLLAMVDEGFGQVLDVGCGRGQLGVALLEAGAASAVLALDRNRAHLQQARLAGDGLPLSIAWRDLSLDQRLPRADTVLLVDVLYQLDLVTQDALLTSAVRAARRRIVIRAADPALGARSLFTRVNERLSRPFWRNAGAHVELRPIAEFTRILETSGFAVLVRPCWRGTPFANVLVLGRRTAAISGT